MRTGTEEVEPLAQLTCSYRFRSGEHILKAALKGQNEFLAWELENEKVKPISQEELFKELRMFILER